MTFLPLWRSIMTGPVTKNPTKFNVQVRSCLQRIDDAICLISKELEKLPQPSGPGISLTDKVKLANALSWLSYQLLTSSGLARLCALSLTDDVLSSRISKACPAPKGSRRLRKTPTSTS